MVDTVATLCVMMEDKLSTVPVKEVAPFLNGFLGYFHRKYPEVVERIEKEGDLADFDKSAILKALDEYAQRQ